MKILKSVSTGVCLLTVLASCQPKDVDLTTTVNNNRNNGNVNSRAASMSQTEVNKMVSLTLDRSAEVVHLIKALLNKDYANQKNIEVIQDKNTDRLMLVSKKPEANKKTMHNLRLNYEVQLVKGEGGKISSIILVQDYHSSVLQSQGIIEVAGKNVDSVSKMKKDMIAVTRKDDNTYLVTISKSEELNSKADRSTNLETFITAQMKWDGSVESLDQAVLIVPNYLSATRTGNKTGLFYTKIKDAGNSGLFVSAGDCISVNGTLETYREMTSKNEKGEIVRENIKALVVEMKDSSYQFIDLLKGNEVSYRSESKSCSDRPVVDLTRIL